MTTTTLDDARAVKGRAMEVFGPLAEVVGIGITRIGEGYGLKVNLRRPPAPNVNLPEEVDGVPVHVEVVGAISKR